MNPGQEQKLCTKCTCTKNCMFFVLLQKVFGVVVVIIIKYLYIAFPHRAANSKGFRKENGTLDIKFEK